MRRLWSSVLLGALFLPGLAHADVIAFNYTGAVTQVPIDDFATGIQPGEPLPETSRSIPWRWTPSQRRPAAVTSPPGRHLG
jgi:hypothetical protein